MNIEEAINSVRVRVIGYGNRCTGIKMMLDLDAAITSYRDTSNIMIDTVAAIMDEYDTSVLLEISIRFIATKTTEMEVLYQQERMTA